MKTKLATVMKEQQRTILDMNTELEKIAEEMTPDFEKVLDEYGIRLVNFYIADISIPETDPNYAMINEAYAQKGILKVQGADWARLSSKELLKDIANNPGAGGVAAAGAGMGMGMAAGGVFRKSCKPNVFTNATRSTKHSRKSTTTTISSIKICPKK